MTQHKTSLQWRKKRFIGAVVAITSFLANHLPHLITVVDLIHGAVSTLRAISTNSAVSQMSKELNSFARELGDSEARSRMLLEKAFGSIDHLSNSEGVTRFPLNLRIIFPVLLRRRSTKMSMNGTYILATQFFKNQN